MVRRRGRGGSRGSLVRSVEKLIKGGALLGPMAARAMTPGRTWDVKVSDIIYDYTGYNIHDRVFNPSNIVNGWGPFVVANLAITGAKKINGLVRKI